MMLNIIILHICNDVTVCYLLWWIKLYIHLGLHLNCVCQTISCLVKLEHKLTKNHHFFLTLSQILSKCSDNRSDCSILIAKFPWGVYQSSYNHFKLIYQVVTHVVITATDELLLLISASFWQHLMRWWVGQLYNVRDISRHVRRININNSFNTKAVKLQNVKWRCVLSSAISVSVRLLSRAVCMVLHANYDPLRSANRASMTECCQCVCRLAHWRVADIGVIWWVETW